MKKICALLGSLTFMLGGCSGQHTEDYAAVTPQLNIRDYLNGPLVAKGILFDYSGKADLLFHVTMQGTWNGNDGTLEEHFTYSDGRVESRTWNIHFTDDHHFTARAGDVIGEATGSQHGNSVNMRYRLNATRSNGAHITLAMDDWMYLLDEHTLINRTKLRKFGITVGKLVITFEKASSHEK